MISRKSWCFGLFVSFALSAPAFADETPPPAARAVVAEQMQDFERGDAAGAWKLAAPEIRDKFVSAAQFVGTLKKSYGPIFSHRSVDFGPAARQGDEVGVVVTIVDNENEVWSALFLLARQKDGAWRTSGCLLAKAQQSSV